MTVPDFQSLMLPVLTTLSNGQPLHVSEIRDRVASAEGVSLEDRQEVLSSGQPVFANRVAWALSHMNGAGLVRRLRQRGVYELSRLGRRLLAEKPARVDLRTLRKYPAYLKWRAGRPPSRPAESKLDDGRPGHLEAPPRHSRVPDFQSLMLPILKALSDGGSTPVSEVRDRVAQAENISAEALQELLPSGRQPVFVNRVAWALVHMQRAGLVQRPRRGVYKITQEGVRRFRAAPARIDLKTLKEYSAYVQWRESSGSRKKSPNVATTPDEALELAIRGLLDELEAEVLARVRSSPPGFLERAIVDLLVAMGYGGGQTAMGQVTGGSGDGGIDGKIREDPLGLDELCLQAKRYAPDQFVSASHLRDFAGAIDGAGMTKGVFVTTSDFSRAARDFVKRSSMRIILINGSDLARLMVDHGVGVRTREQLEVKRLDEDYFGES